MSRGVELFIDPITKYIMDVDGRERVFHGTNVVVKGSPYYPSQDGFDAKTSFVEVNIHYRHALLFRDYYYVIYPPLSHRPTTSIITNKHVVVQEDMELMQSLGFNVVRLSVPWAAVEPIEGQYNETYLEIITGIVDKAGSKYGIYTLIDFHQDAWNAKLCGNGAPDWTVKDPSSFPIPITWTPIQADHDTGHPLEATCRNINNNNWSYFYLSYATSTAIGAMYDNVDNLRDKFVAYWRKVASTFADSLYVVGYELMSAMPP